MAEATVLFDGVCNLCNASVQFIIDRDPYAYFHFAPIQSDYGRELLRSRGMTPPVSSPESILLVEGDRVFDHSTAALRIARHLRGSVRLLWIFAVVPRPIRDQVYRWIARNRYRWFGRTEACRVPTPELRSRFLA